jgi:heme/copper-type cytochrome/quinol oxidase subunit 4
MKFEDDDYSEIEKLAPLFRFLCLFIFLCAVFAILAVIAALISEPFHYITIIGFAVCSIMLHLSGCILFTGYAPSYLLFAHGKVRLDKP